MQDIIPSQEQEMIPFSRILSLFLSLHDVRNPLSLSLSLCAQGQGVANPFQ